MIVEVGQEVDVNALKTGHTRAIKNCLWSQHTKLSRSS